MTARGGLNDRKAGESGVERTLLIVNPAAGRKTGEKIMDGVKGALSENGAEVTCCVTNAPGHAAELAESAGGQYGTIVCCGGDGTLHETLQGLMRAGTRPALGYIPCGTTNDFASTLKLSRDPLEAARSIARHGERLVLDVGRFGADRFFSYVAAFGAFTECSYGTPQPLKNALGYLAYLLEGSKDLFNLKSVSLRGRLDGGEAEGEFVYGSVSNSMSIAALVHLGEDQAALDDGQLELMLVRRPKTLDQLLRAVHMLKKSSFDGEQVIFAHVTRVEFEMSEPTAWTLDGEFGAATENVQIAVEPRALTFLR